MLSRNGIMKLFQCWDEGTDSRLADNRLTDRRQETGDRRQETGDRRQETGDRRQETGIERYCVEEDDDEQ